MAIKVIPPKEIFEPAEVTGVIPVFGNGSGGYEWTTFNSWLDPDSGFFYWYDDSGCSCNGPLESLESVGDLGVGDRDALIRAYKEWVPGGDGYYSFPGEDRASAQRDITLAIREAEKKAREARKKKEN